MSFHESLEFLVLYMAGKASTGRNLSLLKGLEQAK